MAKGGKKGRKAAPVTPITGYEEVLFRDEDQKSNFQKLLGKKIIPTRFIDRTLLNDMGILVAVDKMLIESGVGTLRIMAEHTYEFLTYEFLSSYAYDPKAEKVQFRLLNEEVTMTETEFKDCLGLDYSDEDAVKRAPKGFMHETVWFSVSGSKKFNVSNLRVSQIEHPALRYYFRLVAGTFFGRTEPGKLNRTDLVLAGCALNVQMHEQWDLNFTHLVLDHFQNIADLKLSTIHIGGIITHIAKRHCDFTGENCITMTEVIPRLDEKYLTSYSQHWMDVLDTGGYKWRIGTSRFILLPCPVLPPIVYSDFIEPGQRPAAYVDLTLPAEMVFSEVAPGGVPNFASAGVPTFDSSVAIGFDSAATSFDSGHFTAGQSSSGPNFTDQFFTNHSFSDAFTTGAYSTQPFSGGSGFSTGPYSTVAPFQGPFDTQSTFAGPFSAGAFGSGGSTGAGFSGVPPHTQPPFFSNSFSERRRAHEMVNQNLQGHMLHSFLLDRGYGKPEGPHPSYWQSKESYPGTVFEEYNVDPKEWGIDYGRTYGGLAGQWLFGGQDTGRRRDGDDDGSGPSQPQGSHDGNVGDGTHFDVDTMEP